MVVGIILSYISFQSFLIYLIIWLISFIYCIVTYINEIIGISNNVLENIVSIVLLPFHLFLFICCTYGAFLFASTLYGYFQNSGLFQPSNTGLTVIFGILSGMLTIILLVWCLTYGFFDDI